MCKRFRTLEQCKMRYRAVTVDGSVWRVKQRGLFGWSFVCTERVGFNNDLTFSLTDRPTTFPTQQDAQAAIDRWAQQDYTAQPAAWQ
jgi:hypothetical protein